MDGLFDESNVTYELILICVYFAQAMGNI